MKNHISIPVRDDEKTKTKLMPEKRRKELPTKREKKPSRLDASELFSHFTANIIKEKKVFTR